MMNEHTYEDKMKLEIVKNYNPRELRIILMFLEAEMLYDELGRPYTREYFRNAIDRLGAKND